MYFDKFHDINGKEVCVNSESVIAFFESNEKQSGTVLSLTNGKEVYVKESVKDVARRFDGIFGLRPDPVNQ